jgi:ribonuclease P protein component
MPASHLFPSSHRLLKAKDFKRVFDRAIKLSAQHWTFLYRENDLAHARLGLVISKKHAHRAHERNRLKRIARETFRVHPARHHCVDIVLLAKGHSQMQDNQQIRKDLEKTLSELCEICENPHKISKTN